MREHGIMFSAPMVNAIKAGRKTQTRRLATSPLRRAAVGDRLWVRETFWERKCFTYAADYDADGEAKLRQTGWRKKPAIHMPRLASRFILDLTAVQIEPLQAISCADAVAEGVERKIGGWIDYEDPANATITARESYASLWCALHGEASWQANPDVLVLTFEVSSYVG